MRSSTVWRATVFGLALVVFVPSAMAAGFSIARFVPRLELTAVFVERASPAGTGGSRAGDDARVELSVDDEGDRVRKADPAVDPVGSPGKPGAAGQQRAPRWKSLIPGALK